MRSLQQQLQRRMFKKLGHSYLCFFSALIISQHSFELHFELDDWESVQGLVVSCWWLTDLVILSELCMDNLSALSAVIQMVLSLCLRVHSPTGTYHITQLRHCSCTWVRGTPPSLQLLWAGTVEEQETGIVTVLKELKGVGVLSSSDCWEPAFKH